MGAMEPGERPSDANRPGRQLERPPGERYMAPRGGRRDDAGPARSVLIAAVVKAVFAGVLGSVVLYAVGALLSSSAGLVFVAGLTGTAVGLLIARAAAPGRGDEAALTRREATRLGVGIALGAVVLAAVGTWLHAVGEGGALGLVDYLLETFGIVVPLELLIAAIGAAWGAGAGPVEA